jgi:hypothetical protein
MRFRHTIALVMFASNAAQAQLAGDVIPAAAPNCAIETPPPAVGLAATPGGFVMVFPRNDALPKQYTGCKLMWIVGNVSGEQRQRFVTLYFEDGKLSIAAAHNTRDPAGRLDGACAFPAGKSLLPNAGRAFKDPACAGSANEPFYQLHLPTWPVVCLTDPKAAVCQQDPR